MGAAATATRKTVLAHVDQCTKAANTALAAAEAVNARHNDFMDKVRQDLANLARTANAAIEEVRQEARNERALTRGVLDGHREIAKFRQMTFWQRFAWLFRGEPL